MTEISTALDELPWKLHYRTLRQHFTDVADEKCLMWVNPAQSDPFDCALLESKRKLRVPITHPRFDLRFAPYLVQLDLTQRTDESLLEFSVQLAWEAWTQDHLERRRGQPIAGWVATKHTPEALARHWAIYSHIHVHAGLSKLLRFQDPGVREWLWLMLTKAQQRQLLGPALCLSAIGRHQEVMHQIRPSIAALQSKVSPTEAETQVKKLTLTQRQWDHIEDFAIVHAAWIECRFGKGAGVSSLSPNWQSDIFPALVAATDYGVTHPQDRELFAAHALKMGGGFHAHRKMHDVWKQTQSGSIYGCVLEQILAQAGTDLSQYLSA